MSHIDDSQVLALLDGELDSGAAERVREHMAECGECRRRYRRMEDRSRLLSRALGETDVEPRAGRWDRVVRRARDGAGNAGADGEARPEPASDREPSTRPAAGAPGRAAPFLKAAVILLAVTGVAAAIPGSPVDDWIGGAADRITGWIGDGDGRSRTDGAEAPAEESSPPRVAVSLERGEVTVSLTGAPAGTRVEVTLASGEQAEVQADDARFRTAPGRIEVVDVVGDPIRIRLPEIARAARVLVNGREAVRLEEGRLRLLVDDGTNIGRSESFRIPEPREE